MSSLLDQLLQTHGDEITRRISSALDISPEKAAGVLPAVAPVLLDRFETDAGETDNSLDGVLGGAGEQITERVRVQLGVSQEQAEKVIPLLVPVVLGFLVRRVPYGGGAVRLLSSLVEKQGYGSLDALAIRLVKHVMPESPAPGKPAPSIPTLLGRWAGKWFPSGED